MHLFRYFPASSRISEVRYGQSAWKMSKNFRGKLNWLGSTKLDKATIDHIRRQYVSNEDLL